MNIVQKRISESKNLKEWISFADVDFDIEVDDLVKNYRGSYAIVIEKFINDNYVLCFNLLFSNKETGEMTTGIVTINDSWMYIQKK